MRGSISYKQPSTKRGEAQPRPVADEMLQFTDELRDAIRDLQDLLSSEKR